MTEIDATAAAIDRAAQEVQRATETAVAAATSSDLVLGRDDAQATKLRLADSHSQIARAHRTALAAHAEAKALVEAQRNALEAKLRAMEMELRPLLELSAKLQDGISAVNLYLGRDEELTELRCGLSAPADAPLHIRQQVLHMDEEAALLAEAGGLDFQYIDVFTGWLLSDDANLDQIIPEARGVVALMARSTPVDYTGNAMANAMMNVKNFETWWLIRNGERLYLMTTDFSVGDRLIPERDEFTKMFLMGDSRGGKRSIAPGSREWVQAEKVADAKTRHYMKVALILQGLVDRTAVLHPLPPAGLNLLGQDDYDRGAVVLIADNELAIGMGLPSFSDWQRERLDRLGVGRRVLGHFKEYFGTDERSRIHPKTASGPKKLVAHTITKKDAESFYFSYDRSDSIWRPGEWQGSKAKTRAQYRLDRHPWGAQSYIPVDDVTVEEIRYYLGSRSERHAYKDMFPALQAALAFKEAEDLAEAPFRSLLAAALVAESLAPEDSSLDVTRELISWWKTANKWSRALNGDPAAEGRAQRGVLGEARRRAAGSSRAPKQLSADVIAVAPNRMVVARRTTDFIAVEAQPRIYGAGSVPQNLFVRIHEFTGSGKFRKTSEWKTLTRAQVAKWTVLESTEDWDGWILDVAPRVHLIDDQITAVIAELTAAAVAAHGPVSVIEYWEDQKNNGRVMAQVFYPSRFIVDRWTHDARPGLGELSQPSQQIQIDIGSDGSAKFGRSRGWWTCDRSWSIKWRAEGADRAKSPHASDSGAGGSAAIIWSDETLLAADCELGALWLDERDVQTAVSERCRARDGQIRTAWTVAEEEGRRQRFLEDFGDETLWPDHKKSQSAAAFPVSTVYGKPSVLSVLIERLDRRGVDLSGLTVSEAIELDGGDGSGFPAEVVGLRFAYAKTEG